MKKFNIAPFWDLSYQQLEYEVEPFNNSDDITKWTALGFPGKFTGAMCDMRRSQPLWNQEIINRFEVLLGWQDIGTSYYRMDPGTILPCHQDTYKRYIEIFKLDKPQSVHRAIVFLEDWASGHYLEVDSEPVVKWRAGDVVVWQYDTPHLAANMGTTPRYTLQITGHI